MAESIVIVFVLTPDRTLVLPIDGRAPGSHTSSVLLELAAEGPARRRVLGDDPLTVLNPLAAGAVARGPGGPLRNFAVHD